MAMSCVKSGTGSFRTDMGSGQTAFQASNFCTMAYSLIWLIASIFNGTSISRGMDGSGISDPGRLGLDDNAPVRVFAY